MRQDERNNIISLNEEQTNGKREEELKANMKQQEVPVPDILKPEQIRKRLEEMQTSDYESRKKNFSNKRVGKVWAGAAAGIVLLATVGGSVLLYQNQKKDEMYAKSEMHYEQTTQETTVIEPEAGAVNDTYKEAYEVLEQYQQRYYYEYVDEYDDYDGYKMYEDEEDTRTFGDTFSDIINGIAENFTGNKKYDSASKESQGEVNYAAADVESADMAADSKDSSMEYNYSKNNVRTEGVEECNIVRTDGRYIYEYDEKTSYIHIYNAKGADTSLVGEINLNEYELEVADGFYVADGILTISGTSYRYSDEEKAYTKTLVYDIRKPAKPKFKKIFSQDGIYEESRMVGDTVYVFSSHTVLDRQIEEQKPEGYIPQFEDELVSEKDLYIQPECYVNSYTMISSINVTDCIYIDKKSILGGTGKRYVSSNHIYLLDMDYTAEKEIRFLRFTYEDGQISDKTGGRMKGELNDDYSIDEYKGYLRMVTHYYDERRGDYVNGLFIYDKNLKQIGSIKGIAEGEEIKSARFIGDTAYFVTYRNTDPLFAVDVSNPEKPKMLGYLKIPGFSTYLHPYGDNLLFGLGLETDESSRVLGLKLSMYDISDPADIKEINKLVLPGYEDSEGLYDANALLIDPEKNLIGFSAEGEEYYNDIIDRLEYNTYAYLVYSYDKKQGFVKRLKQRIPGQGYYDYKGRGLYINDYFYVVTIGQDINTYKMRKNSFQLIEEKK